MNRKIVGIGVGMAIMLAASAVAVRAQNSPTGAGIDAALRGAVERKDVPGVVALVIDRRRVLYQGAFGVADVSTGRALAADALFRIASMTKPITSTAAMQLVEEASLSTIRSKSICRSLQT
jgi:methyl acetate hydrolase